MKLPEKYKIDQQKYTSSNVKTAGKLRKRARRNVNCFKEYLDNPILCVGCGEGLEVEFLLSESGKTCENNVLGVEIVHNRVLKAIDKGLPVVEGSAENLLDIVGEKKYNIYCAHTVKHTFNQKLAIENFKKVALNRIVIVVPIEQKGALNKSHYSSISNLGYLANCFGMDWKVINMSYRWNVSLEGVLVLEKDPMKWPRRHKKRSSEIT